MALWIASYPDGAARETRPSGTRVRRMLPATPLLKGLLRRCAGHDVADQVLAMHGGGFFGARYCSDSLCNVRALVRLSAASGGHMQDVLSLWPSQSKLLLDYYGKPLDVYTLEIADVRACSQPEPINSCYAKEQTQLSRRSSDDANLRSVRRRDCSPIFELCICDWSGIAESVTLCEKEHPAAWMWYGQIQQKQHVAEQTFLSDSEDSLRDDALRVASPTALDVLRSWGLAMAPDMIPALLVPEPVAFLISRGQWSSVMLRTSWHRRLVSPAGDQWHPPKPLFHDIPWPPEASAAWENAGAVMQAIPADDIPDLDSQELQLVADKIRRWAPRLRMSEGNEICEELKTTVWKLDAWADQLAVAAGEAHAVGKAGRWNHSTLHLLSSIQVSAFLKGGASKLKDVVQRAVGLVAPASVAGTLCRSFAGDADRQRKKCAALPSASSISRNHLSLDLALIMMRRRRSVVGTVRYLWNDSSPMGGHDWLWCQVHEIAQEQLVPTCRRFFELADMIESYVDGLTAGRDGGDTTSEIELEPLEQWVGPLQQLLEIREYIYPPVSLAMGHTAVAHKASALVHLWVMELLPGTPLTDMANSICSHTSDFGVEHSLPDFAVSSLDALVPDWINREELQPDTDDVSMADRVAAADPADDSSSAFLPTAIPIYGLQHLTNNLNTDVHISLSYWATFYSQLKNVSGLLNHAGRRRRYVATCIRGSRFENEEHKFKRWSATLYEKRWRCIIAFLKHLVPLLGILQSSFSAEKYN